MIGIRVLGPLEVSVDGATADLGGPRQRCVLARLVAAHGRVVSADRLIEDLYADEAPPRALAAVQSYVSHLRRALEPARTARTQPSSPGSSPPSTSREPGTPTTTPLELESDSSEGAASCSIADFTAADEHAAEAMRIADRYDLPTIAALISLYQAMRTALDGDLTGAADRYQQAGDQLDRFGPRLQGTSMSIMGRSTLLIMRSRMAEMTSELGSRPAPFREIYALALAASGRITEAREVAGGLPSVRQDRFWLFLTSLRGLLAIALDDRQRAQPAYQALLPFAARPAGADSMVPLWPVAHLLGDLAQYLHVGDARAHYQHALGIADQAHVALWRDAAMQRLAQVAG